MLGRRQGGGDGRTSHDHRLTGCERPDAFRQVIASAYGAKRFEDLQQQRMPFGWRTRIRNDGGHSHAILGVKSTSC